MLAIPFGMIVRAVKPSTSLVLGGIQLMCGIAGIVAPNATRYENAIEAMVASLAHRGPDGQGVYYFSDCVLGHRRLSIVDLVGGNQPMLGPSKLTGVTFNGEIYGFRELRTEIRHFYFATESDTELLLALYDSYGDEMLSRLPGMFAFALWDERQKRLFAARDRFGEKPFYYAIGHDGEFLFASEIKAILKSGRISARLDQQSLAYYLRRGFVPPHRTIYENVHCLPPAHALIKNEAGLHKWRYWTPPRPVRKIDWGDAVVRFRELLGRAVRRQLVADVPIAAFLSGGLDSSTVVVQACQEQPKLVTMSFGFPGSYDERPFARSLSQMYRTEHIELASHELDMEGTMLGMSRVYDEPFADSSSIPTYLLCQEASKLFKVVLTGDGGDELLGGYSWYIPLLSFERGRSAKLIEYYFHRLLLAILDRVSLRRLFWRREYSRGIVEGHDATSLNSHLRARQSMFSENEVQRLGLSPDPEAGFCSAIAVEAAMDSDVEEYLPGDILVKTDRASMANSLELRAPFLDVELAEFCLSLPHEFKLNNYSDKILLRRTYSEQWPPAIRSRRKQGFGVPLRAWLKHSEIARLVEENLNVPSSPLFDMIDYRGLKSVPIRTVHQTWSLLCLALWRTVW